MTRVVASLFAAALLLSFVGSIPVSAQVIYTPVQYQYFAGGRAYYYGGHDPFIHAKAQQLTYVTGWGRTEGYAFHSGSIDTHREVSTERPRVYSDMIKNQEAGQFGFTDNDARNEAYAEAARYFRKADIARAAIVQPDGSWVVPAATPAAGTIDIRPYRVMAPPAAAPYTEPKPILIIPKRLLDKKLWPSETPTADAR
ncbi:MAG TPA: hypothetical protein VH475_05785 [Tepidisphaeraceae bacterium]|jgi:hypothetical protein